jgi:hypothetical protein
VEQLGPWPARVAWVILAVTAPAPLADALATRSGAVVALTWVALGAAWTGGLVALLVPRTASLTAVRLLVPAGPVVAVFAAWAGPGPEAIDLVAVTAGAIALAAVLAPWFTEAWVDGSSYGAEQRLPLSTPPLLAGVVAPLTWAAVAIAAVTGPLLIATGRWLPGVVAVAVGAVVVRFGARSMHQLSRRWVVLVPTGLVVHDPLTLPEPHLFLRTATASIGPAPADTDALDLTAGASGLAVQLTMREPVELLVREPGRSTTTIQRRAVVFTPARPAHLLDRARAHRLPVGVAPAS